MPEKVREIRAGETERVVPLLLLAEPSESALRWSLRNLSDAAYALEDGGEVVAAVTVRWRRPPCEIVELAVSAGRQGRGYGRSLVEWVCAEAARRGVEEIVVGTRTTSAGNIIFYQKCGFRADHVKPDYFWYYDEPLIEHGIVVRDMLVLRRELRAERDARGDVRAEREARGDVRAEGDARAGGGA